MRVLITGGTGFVGGETAKYLQRRGYEVTVLGRGKAAGERLAEHGVRFVRADVTEGASLLPAFAGQQAVIHCAALASPFGKYADFYKANVEGTRQVIRACFAGGVRRLVNLSTPSLYFDYRNHLNIREDEPLPKRQQTHYGATKLLADRLVAQAQREGLSTLSIRPRAVFGPGDKTVLPRVLSAARNGIFPLVGSGGSLVDMSYIDNVAGALELCLSAQGLAVGQTFNITNGEPIAVRQMVEKLFGELDIPVRFRRLPYPVVNATASAMEAYYRIFRRAGEPPLTRYGVGLMAFSQTLSIEKARKVLGYEPKVSLDDGFGKFAEWWKQVAIQ